MKIRTDQQNKKHTLPEGRGVWLERLKEMRRDERRLKREKKQKITYAPRRPRSMAEGACPSRTHLAGETSN